jgi:hypothetical protein
MRSNLNLALKWMSAVKSKKQIHYIFPNVIKISNLVDSILEKHGLSNCIFAELDGYMNFDNTLTWRFGSPNPNLYVFTPNRMYLDKNNPFLNLWKNCDLDESVMQTFAKYVQPQKILELPESYNLFLMQDSLGLEYEHFMDAVRYAHERKVYTIFKQHPLTEVCTHFSDSEYTIFVDASYNLDHLVNNADKVFSSWSSVGLSAMLAGKVTATYDTMSYSEIMPRISTAYELEDVEPVDRDDLCRFLSWFTHKLCIDVTKEGFDDRIEKRIVDFSKGINVLQ